MMNRFVSRIEFRACIGAARPRVAAPICFHAVSNSDVGLRGPAGNEKRGCG